jgi:hypothetical protein
MNAQSVAERLPSALAPLDCDMLAGIGPPVASPDVPGAVMVPGSGPHDVDYAPAGAKVSLRSSCDGLHDPDPHLIEPQLTVTLSLPSA